MAEKRFGSTSDFCKMKLRRITESFFGVNLGHNEQIYF